MQHQPARFLSIPDLLSRSDPSQEGLLRVIGRLEGYDIEHSILWLQDHSTSSLQIAVDSSNIEPFPFRRGLLYQFIGEANYRDVPITTDMEIVYCRKRADGDDLSINGATGRIHKIDVPSCGEDVEMDTAVAGIENQTTRCVVMKALLFRCVDGLDMGVYTRAHEARMKMIQASQQA